MRAFNEAASSSRLRSRGYEPVNDSQPLAKKKKKTRVSPFPWEERRRREKKRWPRNGDLVSFTRNEAQDSMRVVNGIEISCIPASCVRDGVEDKHTQISKIRDLNGLIAALFARLLTFIVVIQGGWMNWNDYSLLSVNIYLTSWDRSR